MTTVCSKCAEGAPSAVLTVHPSASVADSPDPLEMTGSIADDQAGPEMSIVPWVVVVGHKRFFVNRSADAVASKLRNYPEALAFDCGLYGSSDPIQRSVGPGNFEGVVQRRSGASSQSAFP